MAKGNEELSQAEIWDDSALIDSWNSALDEYKTYHSIHAKGGSLEDLEEAVRASSEKNTQAREKLEQVKSEPQDEPQGEAPPPVSVSAPSIAAPVPPPQALLGSMQDEGLKKLLMSWYYAGYYTGLYEGQQHAQQKNQQGSKD